MCTSTHIRAAERTNLMEQARRQRSYNQPYNNGNNTNHHNTTAKWIGSTQAIVCSTATYSMSQGSRQFRSFICIWTNMPFRWVRQPMRPRRITKNNRPLRRRFQCWTGNFRFLFRVFFLCFFFLSLSVFVFSGFRVYLCTSTHAHTHTHALSCGCVWVVLLIFLVFHLADSSFHVFYEIEYYNGMTPNVFRAVEKALD